MKRLRRDRRYIMVDDMETAENIKRYCLSEIIDDRWCSCYISNDRSVFGVKIAVCFYCTLEEWRQIMNQYDLIKTKDYNHWFHKYEIKTHPL